MTTFELCFPENYKNKMGIKILILISHTKLKDLDNVFTISAVMKLAVREFLVTSLDDNDIIDLNNRNKVMALYFI